MDTARTRAALFKEWRAKKILVKTICLKLERLRKLKEIDLAFPVTLAHRCPRVSRQSSPHCTSGASTLFMSSDFESHLVRFLNIREDVLLLTHLLLHHHFHDVCGWPRGHPH